MRARCGQPGGTCLVFGALTWLGNSLATDPRLPWLPCWESCWESSSNDLAMGSQHDDVVNVVHVLDGGEPVGHFLLALTWHCLYRRYSCLGVCGHLLLEIGTWHIQL